MSAIMQYGSQVAADAGGEAAQFGQVVGFDGLQPGGQYGAPRRRDVNLADDRTCWCRRCKRGHQAAAFCAISASSSVRWPGWVDSALLIIRGLGAAGA
jgi:hypothetical protein